MFGVTVSRIIIFTVLISTSCVQIETPDGEKKKEVSRQGKKENKEVNRERKRNSPREQK